MALVVNKAGYPLKAQLTEDDVFSSSIIDLKAEYVFPPHCLR